MSALKTKLTVILLTLTFLTCKAQFLADGFKKEQGDVTIGLSAGKQSWGTYYAADKNVGISRKSTIVSSYVSINPLTSLRIAASLPYIKVTKTDVKGFQDVFAQVQYMPLRTNNWTAYVLFGYGAPVSDYATESATAIGQQAVVRSYGLGAQYTQSWWFVSASFNHQEKNFPTPNAKQAQLKGGIFKGKWYGALRYDLQYSIGGSDYRDGTFRPFTTLGSGYSKISADVYRRLNKIFGVSISLSQTVAGRNVGNSTEAYVSFIADLKILKKAK